MEQFIVSRVATVKGGCIELVMLGAPGEEARVRMDVDGALALAEQVAKVARGEAPVAAWAAAKSPWGWS